MFVFMFLIQVGCSGDCQVFRRCFLPLLCLASSMHDFVRIKKVSFKMRISFQNFFFHLVISFSKELCMYNIFSGKEAKHFSHVRKLVFLIFVLLLSGSYRRERMFLFSRYNKLLSLWKI